MVGPDGRVVAATRRRVGVEVGVGVGVEVAVGFGGYVEIGVRVLFVPSGSAFGGSGRAPGSPALAFGDTV